MRNPDYDDKANPGVKRDDVREKKDCAKICIYSSIAHVYTNIYTCAFLVLSIIMGR